MLKNVSRRIELAKELSALSVALPVEKNWRVLTLPVGIQIETSSHNEKSEWMDACLGEATKQEPRREGMWRIKHSRSPNPYHFVLLHAISSNYKTVIG